MKRLEASESSCNEKHRFSEALGTLASVLTFAEHFGASFARLVRDYGCKISCQANPGTFTPILLLMALINVHDPVFR